MASSTPPETRQFNHDVQFLLKPNNPHARSLLAFIHRTIRQFNLESYITEVDVFVEAYLRGVKHTGQHGEPIHQSRAWLRSTAYNIIREWKRDRQKYSNAAFDELVEQGTVGHPADPPAADGEPDLPWVEVDLQTVIQAFRELPEGERDLISWKVIENLSWQAIQDRLVAQGEAPVSLPALRKRGQRALERLRQNYHRQHPGAD